MSGLPPQIEADLGSRATAAGRTQLEFEDNLLLPALYGERDQHLDRIERQLGVSLIPRGNRLSIAGPASATELSRLVLTRLYERLKRGQDIDTASVDAAIRLGAGRDRRQDPGAVARRHRVPHAQAAHRAALGGTGALCQGDARARAGVRPRPRRHRENLSRGRRRDRSVDDRQGRADHSVATGGRGRRAARFSARRSAREGRPLSAADLRRAERHAAGRPARKAPCQRRDRGGADRVHARPHAGARLRDPRRGAEHDAGADEDVPDPARRGLAHGRDRRSDPGRSAARHPLRARRRAGSAARRRGYRRRPVHREGCRAAPAGGAHRRRLRGARPRPPRRRGAGGERQSHRAFRWTGCRAARVVAEPSAVAADAHSSLPP